MRKINNNKYEVETNENGVLHLVIGCDISANTVLDNATLEQIVKGKFRFSELFGAVIHVGERFYPIDEKTISYL